MKRLILSVAFIGLLMALFAPATFAQRVIVTPSIYTAGGTVSVTTTTTSSTASVNVTTSPAMIYGLTVDAGATSNTIWINVYNAASASVTSGTTIPVMSVQVNGAQNPYAEGIPFGIPTGIPFSTALSVNCTTAYNGTVPCPVVARVNVFRR